MWYYNKDNDSIVNLSDTHDSSTTFVAIERDAITINKNTKTIQPIGTVKHPVRYLIGTIENADVGTLAGTYPNKKAQISNSDINCGRKNNKDRFGFIFSGKDLETDEVYNKKYLSNYNSIMIVYNGEYVHPAFLNDVESRMCIIRAVEYIFDNGKKALYPNTVYPIVMNDEDMKYYIEDWKRNYRSSGCNVDYGNFDKYNPYHKVTPTVKWTK